MRSDPSRFPAPNTVCYNAALMALMRRGRWREARGLLTEVAATSRAAAEGGEERERERGGGGGERGSHQGAEVLDFLSYNSVIRACAAAGEAEEVSGVCLDDWYSCEDILDSLAESCRSH